MSIVHGFAGAIGNTPLIRLDGPSRATGCEILGKAEFMNPGGSVKDRAARAIIEDAERSGRLKPGGTVVEGTAGNTGIALAHLCLARGYRPLIVMPDNQSPEKYQALAALGVEVRSVPAVPYANENHQVELVRAVERELAPSGKQLGAPLRVAIIPDPGGVGTIQRRRQLAIELHRRPGERVSKADTAVVGHQEYVHVDAAQAQRPVGVGPVGGKGPLDEVGALGR